MTRALSQKTLALLQVLMPVFAILVAIPMAFAQAPGKKPGPTTSASSSASASASTAPPASPPAASAPATSAAAPDPALAVAVANKHFTSALGPMPNDQKTPTALLPPGSFDDDPGPSDIIFPQQHLTLRFNHKLHMSKDVGATCKTCHALAYTSSDPHDFLIPRGTICDACHATDHSDLTHVQPADDEKGQCAFCHLGYRPENGNAVAKLEMPRANMRFTHKKHIDRNINCQQCHGAVQELELSTRDQLPRMRGCFGCHEMPDSAARGEAKSACTTCHLRASTPSPMEGPSGGMSEGGVLKTMFATGQLKPPRWLHNAAHTPDFIERHKTIAANDSQFCANCHSENFCADCHDGRVRPRSVHPNDYISMHPIEARQATQRCTSCHREQSFCLGCHQRLGITMSGPPDARMSGRFHPPKSIWSDPPRQPGHHSFEAERNLNACVSCHTERDCVVCHGGQGVGGGFDPHRTGFAGGCATQFRRNPRPCFVCHQPGDGVLNQCR